MCSEDDAGGGRTESKKRKEKKRKVKKDGGTDGIRRVLCVSRAPVRSPLRSTLHKGETTALSWGTPNMMAGKTPQGRPPRADELRNWRTPMQFSSLLRGPDDAATRAEQPDG